jgi:hypothetical protein
VTDDRVGMDRAVKDRQRRARIATVAERAENRSSASVERGTLARPNGLQKFLILRQKRLQRFHVHSPCSFVSADPLKA